ncbi:MAG: ATP-binding protein [Planctomycetes bacterium]|nr:ATP-binding protein [Planctomycetota bacterium]
MPAKSQVLLSWSSGKDSAWSLHILRQSKEIEVVGLLTSFNETFNRVAMHAVRRELVEEQARAAGLPLWPVPLPWPCSNDEYESRMQAVFAKARAEGISGIAFGDLHLEDIRAYRERQLNGTGLTPHFPIWSSVPALPALAREMIAGGLQAVLTCVDPRQLSPDYSGRFFDAALLDDLPESVDHCGERGEFHTFCFAGPMFDRSIPIRVGERVERDGFWFTDVEIDARLTHPSSATRAASSR